jgi:hypothetical protein
MVEYIKTSKGYFYKKYINGKNIRISEDKYNKYINKNKFFMNGGEPRKLVYFPDAFETLGNCVKELIEGSYEIYLDILSKEIPTTIVCGGQSPSYYCLAMMNFPIYNPELVNIVVLPHSKHGIKSRNPSKENRLYCERLKEKNILLRKNVVIIDGVHSGTGILALESALKHCFRGIKVTRIAINTLKGISEIPVHKEIIFRCESLFSDTFPRLVTHYYPYQFSNSTKFITEFINLETYIK